MVATHAMVTTNSVTTNTPLPVARYTTSLLWLPGLGAVGVRGCGLVWSSVTSCSCGGIVVVLGSPLVGRVVSGVLIVFVASGAVVAPLVVSGVLEVSSGPL